MKPGDLAVFSACYRSRHITYEEDRETLFAILEVWRSPWSGNTYCTTYNTRTHAIHKYYSTDMDVV